MSKLKKFEETTQKQQEVNFVDHQFRIGEKKKKIIVARISKLTAIID